MNNNTDHSKIAKQFPGLIDAAEGFNFHAYLDYLPNSEVEGVYMFQIQFIKERVYGLCIWDSNKKKYIEEPGSYKDYGLTEEQAEKKYNFSHNRLNKKS